ncbi:MAG: MupG family TIM beta-alpha barrel fold protein [Eubacteriales bacterium]|nr:MupG family TIM beta-alpha barrel fold protein [Eubacteriales bacterium]
MKLSSSKQSIGFSAFLTGFESQKPLLAEAAKASASGLMLFTSLHVYEEVSATYAAEMKELCNWLTAHNFRIIADVSKRTKDYFEQEDLTVLAKELGIWALRPDYGFELEEIKYFATQLPLVVNATTTGIETIVELQEVARELYAMHNYYPRPETGLDPPFFQALNAELRDCGVGIMAFVPGDTKVRQPLGEGLPTLESQRALPPSVAYVEMLVRYGVDYVFLGDPGISASELARIQDYAETSILKLPARLDPAYHSLYGKVFTHRVDSPSTLIRFAESREYAVQGAKTEVGLTLPRPRGSLTIDNERYKRYSGEIQLLREDFPADQRVNLIGAIDESYLALIDCIPRGSRLMLIEA